MPADDVLVSNYIPTRNFVEKGSGILDAGGAGSFTIPGPKPGYQWMIQRISNTVISVAASELRWYEISQGVVAGTESGEDEFEFTPAGNDDIADENSAPVIHEGNSIRGIFAGADASSPYTFRLQIQEVFVQKVMVPRTTRVSVMAEAIGSR